MDCIAQCLWKHHSNQKITSYSFILFRTCVDIILNMCCPFGLLEAFPWIVFVYFFHRNSWVFFFTSSFLFQELSYMMSIFFSNFPFQQLSLCCDFFSDFFFQELSHLMWNLFRFFPFQGTVPFEVISFQKFPFSETITYEVNSFMIFSFKECHTWPYPLYTWTEL